MQTPTPQDLQCPQEKIAQKTEVESARCTGDMHTCPPISLCTPTDCCHDEVAFTTHPSPMPSKTSVVLLANRINAPGNSSTTPFANSK
uniref:Uncharacterized protein n=2 Tax=Anguilla anguilla TaxID=7936 RepID=A0A0E9SL66_ANGAN